MACCFCAFSNSFCCCWNWQVISAFTAWTWLHLMPGDQDRSGEPKLRRVVFLRPWVIQGECFVVLPIISIPPLYGLAEVILFSLSSQGSIHPLNFFKINYFLYWYTSKAFSALRIVFCWPRSSRGNAQIENRRQPTLVTNLQGHPDILKKNHLPAGRASGSRHIWPSRQLRSVTHSAIRAVNDGHPPFTCRAPQSVRCSTLCALSLTAPSSSLGCCQTN